MSSPQVPVRSRRSAVDVAVVGGALPLRRAMLVGLVQAAARGGAGAPGGARVRSVVDAGPEPAEVGGTRFRLADLDAPGAPDLARSLEGIDAVVYCAVRAELAREIEEPPQLRRELSLRRAQAVVGAAVAAGVAHLVVVSSARVYGARPDNPLPLPDGAPLRAPTDGGLVVSDLLDVEQLCAVARDLNPDLAVTVLRPAALVGEGVDTVITRHFEAPRLLVVKGAEPVWQFCHLEDLGSAAAVVVAHRLGPEVNVGCDGWLTQEQVERLTGMRRLELSLAVAEGTADRLHRVGLLPAPASDLAFVVYPWAVSSQTLRASGWEPAYDNETCLGVLMDGVRGLHAVAARRVDRKDAALGAASAAVAMLGTTAMMRRRRRKGG